MIDETRDRRDVRDPRQGSGFGGLAYGVGLACVIVLAGHLAPPGAVEPVPRIASERFFVDHRNVVYATPGTRAIQRYTGVAGSSAESVSATGVAGVPAVGDPFESDPIGPGNSLAGAGIFRIRACGDAGTWVPAGN